MQLNIRTDTKFTRELDALVRKTGLKTRTAAIKHAVHATLVRPYDFRRVIGVAGKLNPRARFRSDDDLHRDETK